MIGFQTQRTKLPTRPAAARRGRISMAASVSSVAIFARLLSACSSFPQPFPATTAVTEYPDLNDPPPTVAVRVEQLAQIKAELIQARDDQECASAQQQALR
jgi:hypothetical protein